MDKQVLIVSLVTGFLGLLSVILGFTAEVTKITASDISIYLYDCYYPSSPALGLGITAAMLLVLAQILVTAFAGCCGCCKKVPTAPAVSDTKRTLNIISVVISWITFAIAVILLILGAVNNGPGDETRSTDSNCYVVKPGIFAGGAICALFTMALSITAYIISSPPTSAASKPTDVQLQGVAIGIPQPQYPPAQPHYQAPGVGGTNKYSAPVVGGTQYPPPGTNYSA